MYMYVPFLNFCFRSWTEEQTNALRQSSLDIPPTTHNYWGCMAESVPGKTAFECQTKHYESVISSKNVTQCTDVNALSANNKKNGKKRGRRPTAREQFSRYLQMVGGNAVIPSTVLEDTSKMNADDLLQVRLYCRWHANIYIYLWESIAFCFVVLVIARISDAQTRPPCVCFPFQYAHPRIAQCEWLRRQ